LIGVDDAPTVRGERAQDVKGLRPHTDFSAVAKEATGREVDCEGAESDVWH
jgi:hypothetical protein